MVNYKLTLDKTAPDDDRKVDDPATQVTIETPAFGVGEIVDVKIVSPIGKLD